MPTFHFVQWSALASGERCGAKNCHAAAGAALFGVDMRLVILLAPAMRSFYDVSAKCSKIPNPFKNVKR